MCRFQLSRIYSDSIVGKTNFEKGINYVPPQHTKKKFPGKFYGLHNALSVMEMTRGISVEEEGCIELFRRTERVGCGFVT